MQLTTEQRHIYYVNHKAAMEYFGIENGDGLVMHHVDESLRHNDLDRYLEWNPEDLEVMAKEKHASLHHTGHHRKHSEETKQRIRESNTGRKQSLETRQKRSESLKLAYAEGRRTKGHSEETRKKLSESHKGNHNALGHMLSDEAKDKMSKAKKGKHWKVVDGKRVWYDESRVLG